MIHSAYCKESDQRCIVSQWQLVGLQAQYSAALRPSRLQLEVWDDTTPGAWVLHLKSILSPDYLRWLILEEVASGLPPTVETWQTATGRLTENCLVLTSIFMTQP